MSFLVFLLGAPLFILFSGAWSSFPFIFNVWFSVLTGMLILFLWSTGGGAAAISLFLVEESLSLLLMAIWFIFGGGLLLLLVLFMKSAIAPFHAWLIHVLSSCGKEAFAWGLSGHKLPMVLLFSSIGLSSGASFVVLSGGVGVFFLLMLGSVRSMVVLSSSNMFCSLLLVFWGFGEESSLFFFCYCLIIWSSLLSAGSLDSWLFLVGLMGVPPFLLFQLKWLLLCPLLKEAPALAFLFLLLSGVSVMVYVRLCFLTGLRSEGSENLEFLGAWALLSSGLLLL